MGQVYVAPSLLRQEPETASFWLLIAPRSCDFA